MQNQNRNEQRNSRRRGGGGRDQEWQGQGQNWGPQQYDPRAGQFIGYPFGPPPQFGVGGFSYGPTIPGIFGGGGTQQRQSEGRRRRRRGRNRDRDQDQGFRGENGTLGLSTRDQNPIERVYNRMNYAGLAPKNYHRSDAAIQDDANHALTRHGGIDAREIEVTVARNGEVNLKGVVPTRRMKLLAEDTVSRVPGVKDIHNEIRVLSADELIQRQERELTTRGGQNDARFTGGQAQRSVS